MNETRILIARLGWPSTSARWWTMQELADRLGEPAARAETEVALLQFVQSRKLEAEIVEALCIFWMAVQKHGYSPAENLAENILKPSLLSDLLLESCGLPIHTSDMGLSEVPEDFEIPDDFDGVQGVDLPKMFLTSMRRLEACSGFPFVRQMAFEWTENRAAYPDVPYQGDPWHFTRPLGNDFIGHLSTRAAVRAISAYLRVLAVAELFWGLPPDLADKKALLALPIHPSMALLRPRRPEWFPASTDFDGNALAVEAAFRALIARVEAVRPSDELVAFNSPVLISMGRCVEVSLVRWSQAVGSSIDDADLAVHLESFWAQEQCLSSVAPGALSTTTIVTPQSIEQLVDVESKSWPLAGTLDFDRIGYLQHDLYPTRLLFPTLPSMNAFEFTPLDGQLVIKVDEHVIADFCYWNAGWGAARPKWLSGNCGTALVSRGTVYREVYGHDSVPLRDFYLWQVRTLSRDHTYEQFSEKLATGTIFL